MTGLDLFEAIGEIDFDLVEEAERRVFIPRRRKNPAPMLAVAAILIMLLVPTWPLLLMVAMGGAGASGESLPNDAEAKDEFQMETEAPGLTGAAPETRLEYALDGDLSFADSSSGVKLEKVTKGGVSRQLLMNSSNVTETVTLVRETEMTLSELVGGIPTLELVDRSSSVSVEKSRVVEASSLELIGVTYNGTLEDADSLYNELGAKTELGVILTRNELLACLEEAVADTDGNHAQIISHTLTTPRCVRFEYELELAAGESVEPRSGEKLAIADMVLEEVEELIAQYEERLDALDADDPENASQISFLQGELNEKRRLREQLLGRK